MRYEEMLLNWVLAEDVAGEEDEVGLSAGELARLGWFAERPDLADPLIWFLPERRVGRGR